VPGKEVSSVVNQESLLDMSTEEVIVAVLTARAFRLGRLWRQLGHALNSINVVGLFRLGESRPRSVRAQPCLICSKFLPFLAENNVRGVALLVLGGLFSTLVDLLIDGGDPSINICLKNLSSNGVWGDVLPLVKGHRGRRLLDDGNGAG